MIVIENGAVVPGNESCEAVPSRVLVAGAPATYERIASALRGYAVDFSDTLPNAKKALDSKDYHLVLIGFHFGDSGMFEFLRHARSRSADLPIVCFRALRGALRKNTLRAAEMASRVLGAAAFLNLFEYPDEATGNRVLRRLVDKLLIHEHMRHCRIMSLILAPLDEEVRAGPVSVHGVAWNDGTVPITEVQLSGDGGKSWKDALVRKAADAFALHFWEAHLSLHKGEHTLIARATDSIGPGPLRDRKGSQQAADCEEHGVDRVKITAV